MKSYKLIISYVGTAYQGWQAQATGKTISQTMQKAFERTFHGSCTLVAASRTDAGVHALCQVVSCVTDIVLVSDDQLRFAWNNALPFDIMIRTLESVRNRFNPFQNVSQKTYLYTIYQNRPLPYDAPFGWYYPNDLNIETLKSALNLFVGTHNFLSFSTPEPNVNPVRTVNEILVEMKTEKIVITVIGKSFIRHMVRRIIGAAITVASRQTKTIKNIIALLENPAELYCFETAPAHGLSLDRIAYAEETT